MLDGARLTAYDVLDGVSSRAAYANLLLPQLLRERQLDERDAAFATQLAYGTLRAQGTLDAILTGLVSRPLAELDPRVLDLLRLGAYQLIDLRVPVARRRRHHRRPHPGHRRHRAPPAWSTPCCARSPPAATARSGWPRLGGDAEERLALATDHPRWIVDAWRDALGGDDDELEAGAAGRRRRPRGAPGRPPASTARRWSRSPGASRGPWSPYAVRLPGGDPGRLPSVRSGAAAVQDEGSQLAALLLARAPLDGPDAAWLDMCAGPGGKAGLLAAVRPGRRAADRRRPRAAPRRAGPAGAGRRGRRRGAGRRRHRRRRGRRARSTGCCSTRRAPGWARCAAVPRCAGGGRRTTSRRWSSCRRRCWTARWPRCGSAESSPT